MQQHCNQHVFCKIRATEYRLKYIWISNRLLYLGRINKKVTAKRTAVILIPVLRKAPNVGCNAMRHPKIPKYLIDLIDIDDSDFLLTDDVNKLDLEIYNNCIYISFNPKEIIDISSSDIETFIADLKRDRERKLRNSNIEVDIAY